MGEGWGGEEKEEEGRRWRSGGIWGLGGVGLRGVDVARQMCGRGTVQVPCGVTSKECKGNGECNSNRNYGGPSLCSG